MSKRRYTNMVALLPIIEKMLAGGMSHREIETELCQKEIGQDITI